MAVSHFSGGGKNLLLQFNTPMPGGRAARLDRKQAAARNAAIEAALLAEGTPAVKLSPATEAQARAMGRAVGERIVAFAKERGWLAKADVVCGCALARAGTEAIAVASNATGRNVIELSALRAAP